MAATADDNIGFKGEVGSADTPFVFGRPARYGVDQAADLKVTAGGTGDRALTVAAGTAWGDAVLSKFNTTTNLNGTSVSSGSRWDTVVVRRAWDPEGDPTGTATLMLLAGGSSKAIAAGRTTDAGETTSDQPLALVRFTAGQTTAQEIVDLRVWAANGGLYAANPLAQQYLTDPGTTFVSGSTQYVRTVASDGTLSWQTWDLSQGAAFLSQTAPVRSGGTNLYARMAPFGSYGGGAQFSISDTPGSEGWYAQKPNGSGGVTTVWQFDTNGNLTTGKVPYSALVSPVRSSTAADYADDWTFTQAGTGYALVAERQGNQVLLRIAARWAGSALVSGAAGGLSDEVMGQINNPAFIPRYKWDWYGHYYAANGGQVPCGGTIDTNGFIMLTFLAPNTNLPSNHTNGTPSLFLYANYPVT